MHPLTSSELLDTWERGFQEHPVQRALLLLAAACPEHSLQDLAQLSLPERDARLLELRELIFGPRLASLVTCPACGVQLEASLLARDLRSSLDAPLAADYPAVTPGFHIRFRLPNSLDLLAILPSQEPAFARSMLLERCLVSVERSPESPVQSGEAELPQVLEAVAQGLDTLASHSETELGLACAACGHTWEASLDFPLFFWTEITAWARRLLVEIHTLARAYGWHEADILAMTPTRRQIYLELARG